LYIAREQNYINKEEFNKFYGRCESLSKMLHSFRSYLKNYKLSTIDHRL